MTDDDRLTTGDDALMKNDDGLPRNEEPSEAGTMVRSEERLTVHLPVRVSGGVLVRKRVVTETVTQTFQLRREELEVLEVPVEELTTLGTSTAQAAHHQFYEHDFELILHEERLRVTTEVVPVERVTVRRRVATHDVPVTADMRVEHIQLVETDTDHAPAPTAER